MGRLCKAQPIAHLSISPYKKEKSPVFDFLHFDKRRERERKQLCIFNHCKKIKIPLNMKKAKNLFNQK